jgi:hypothetical protein
MPTTALRALTMGATVWEMHDPIPIHIAHERVRAGIDDAVPERPPARSRVLVASLLHRLADRVEGRTAHPRPATQSAA